MSSKRIKEIIKNAEPAKGTNADPGQLGQYSATNQVNEGDLNQYLSSRGINPKFVSRETKISHAKSATFQKWKADHKNEEVEYEEPLVEDAMLDKYLSSRGINPKYATKNMKVAHAKSGEFIKWKHDHMVEEVVTEETDTKDMVCMDIPLLIRVLEFTREEMSSDIELHNMVERLINMRDNIPLDMAHYDAITSKLVKEEVLDESPKEGGRRKFSGMYNPAPKGTFAYDQAMRKKKHDEIEKNQSKDGSGMTSAIDRLEKHMNKEEVVTEMDKTQTPPGRSGDEKLGVKEYTGTPVKAKDFMKSTVKSLKKHMNKEDVFQDPQAATQTVFDNGTSTNDTSPKSNMSKSARMIKSIYKKLNMKEDTYDWEKDDKNQTSLGKKTKEVKEKPDARAILTGGKTLTGDTRDTLEIDPMMKNRPDLNGTVKDNENSKKNNKINN